MLVLLFGGLLYTMSNDPNKYDISPALGSYPGDASSSVLATADNHTNYNVNASSPAVPIFSMAFVSQIILDSVTNFQTSFTQNTGNIVTDTLSKLASGFGLMVFLTIGIAIATFVLLFQAVNLVWGMINIFDSLPPPFNFIGAAAISGGLGIGTVLVVAITLNMAMKVYRSIKVGDNI